MKDTEARDRIKFAERDINNQFSELTFLKNDVYKLRRKVELLMDHLGLERELDKEPRLKKKEECS